MEPFSSAITFATADGTETHAPMVLATVGGLETRLICDTGASEHVLTTDLARRAGAHLEPDEPGTDAAGDLVPSWRIDRLAGSLAGWSIPLDGAPVADGPPPFAGWGIGGFLSPQALHRAAWIVLDLASRTLSVADDPLDTLVADLQRRHPALRPIRLRRDPSDTTVLVRAAVDGYPEVLTLIDSGARSTSFAAAALPGMVPGEEAVSGRAVGGREMRAPTVEGARVRVGDAVLPVGSLFVSPEARDGVEGVIGMDLLRGTVLVVAADLERPVTWFVPR
jgi:Aspartyl protease